MSELGNKLKKARQEKGVSLDELQQKTKIQKRYLEAIEAGNYSEMPGDFYARAFIKSYAEAVGLHSAELFEEHAEELPQPKRSDPQGLPKRTARKKTSTGAPREKPPLITLLPTILAISVIVAVGFAFWLFNQSDDGTQGSNSSPPSNIAADETDDAEADEETSDQSNEENESGNEGSQLTFESREDNRFTYSMSGNEEMEVEMVFSGGSWVQILDSEGNEIHQQEHSDGEEASFDFSEETEVTFNLGNARTASIFINGEELQYETDDHRIYIILQNNTS
ncbi:helix-turn-helix domain-containing protein [Alkalicoccus halolimnae]|uniref:RodZ domain-containing protein n=1 Tax=Alkalicoccus halolimnae TaxID=1667239 RepID=A0A5C7F9J2_9BACI|nr:helix-turn-helix domain-containing protein [Alkalicoccus halolimnae]TXF87322.1 helix-turn-helix domain-containing protein [Alkalicoccus halolimnae]